MVKNIKRFYCQLLVISFTNNIMTTYCMCGVGAANIQLEEHNTANYF